MNYLFEKRKVMKKSCVVLFFVLFALSSVLNAKYTLKKFDKDAGNFFKPGGAKKTVSTIADNNTVGNIAAISIVATNDAIDAIPVDSIVAGTSNITNIAGAGVEDGIGVVKDPMAAIKQAIRKKYPVETPLSDDQLQVRVGQDLCPREIDFINNRMPKVTQALQQNFGIDKPLKIALCASGGGNRAMLSTLGFYLGAQDIGLFDTLLYTMGVSGSTWTIAPWSCMNAMMAMSLVDFREKLVNNSLLSQSMLKLAPEIYTAAKPSKSLQDNMSGNITKHFGYDQYGSSVDIYSGFIGNYSLLPLGPNRLNFKWSAIAPIVEQGGMPLPLGAAISVKKEKSEKEPGEYYWFEVSPFEVGGDEVGGYVPLSAFGSEFKNGKPVAGYRGHCPEYPISYFQGVFGSSFEASLDEMFDFKIPVEDFKIGKVHIKLPINQWLQSKDLQGLRDSRFCPATFHNYMKGLLASPLSDKKEFQLYDAGIDFNFPLPLAMRSARQIDVIIICDSGPGVDWNTLQNAQRYFQRRGIKIPDFSKTQGAGYLMTVFNDPRLADYQKDLVTVLYCSFDKNNVFSPTFDPANCTFSGYCQTFNFKYTPDQAAQVVDCMRFNVKAMKSNFQGIFNALQPKVTKDAVATIDSSHLATIQVDSNDKAIADKRARRLARIQQTQQDQPIAQVLQAAQLPQTTQQ
jgi:hypothetical protein